MLDIGPKHLARHWPETSELSGKALLSVLERLERVSVFLFSFCPSFHFIIPWVRPVGSLPSEETENAQCLPQIDPREPTCFSSLI